MLGVDPRTVSGALSTRGGSIPARSVGRRVVIPRAPFMAWLAGTEVTPEPTVTEPPAVDATAVIRAKLIELLGALDGIDR